MWSPAVFISPADPLHLKAGLETNRRAEHEFMLRCLCSVLDDGDRRGESFSGKPIVQKLRHGLNGQGHGVSLSHASKTHTHQQTESSDVSHSFPKIRWQISPVEKMTSQNFPNSHRYSLQHPSCDHPVWWRDRGHPLWFEPKSLSVSLDSHISISEKCSDTTRLWCNPDSVAEHVTAALEKFLFRIFPQCM